MRRRRFLGMGAGLTGAVSGALGLSTTTACGGDPGEGGEVVLSLVATEYGDGPGQASSKQSWLEMVERFQRTRPGIRVDVSMVPAEHATKEITRLIDSGKAPDIAQVTDFAEFAAADQLYPASQLLPLPTLATFIPSTIIAGNHDRTHYALPFAALVTRFFYNKQLFRDAGLDPQAPPLTWGGLRDAAQALRDAGVSTPFALPLGHGDAYVEAAAWMLSGGGGIADPTGSYTFESLANSDALHWLREQLVSPGLCGPDAPANSDRATAYAGFADGTTGMLFGDTRLISQADAAGIDFGTGQLPGYGGPTAQAPGQASWVLGFNVNQRGEEIAEFLDFVYGDAALATFPGHHGYLPVTTSAVEELHISSAPDDRRLVPFVEDLEVAVFFPSGKVSWPQVSSLVAERIGGAVEPGGDISVILDDLKIEARALDRQAAADSA